MARMSLRQPLHLNCGRSLLRPVEHLMLKSVFSNILVQATSNKASFTPWTLCEPRVSNVFLPSAFSFSFYFLTLTFITFTSCNFITVKWFQPSLFLVIAHIIVFLLLLTFAPTLLTFLNFTLQPCDCGQASSASYDCSHLCFSATAVVS